MNLIDCAQNTEIFLFCLPGLHYLKFKPMTGSASVLFIGIHLMLIVLYLRWNILNSGFLIYLEWRVEGNYIKNWWNRA